VPVGSQIGGAIKPDSPQIVISSFHTTDLSQARTLPFCRPAVGPITWSRQERHPAVRRHQPRVRIGAAHRSNWPTVCIGAITAQTSAPSPKSSAVSVVSANRIPVRTVRGGATALRNRDGVAPTRAAFPLTPTPEIL
jgi:hypothetical protein